MGVVAMNYNLLKVRKQTKMMIMLIVITMMIFVDEIDGRKQYGDMIMLLMMTLKITSAIKSTQLCALP